jgi:hypothetical protein
MTLLAAFRCKMSFGRKHMKRPVLFPLLIIPLLAGLSVAALQRFDASSESYAVYSVLIPQIPSVPEKNFLIATDTVLYDETKSQFPVEPENLVTREAFNRRLANATGSEWDRIWRSQPCGLAPQAEREAYLSAMLDYRRNNDVAMRLERRLDLPRPYELVDVSELVATRNRWHWCS